MRFLHRHEIASLMILFLTPSYTQPSYTQPSEASASPISHGAAQRSRVDHFVKSPTPCSARPIGARVSYFRDKLKSCFGELTRCNIHVVYMFWIVIWCFDDVTV
jgi:hypothetical protein